MRDLSSRGWLFDGEPLKEIIEDQLDSIGKYQREGKIHNLYTYFKYAWIRYVDSHAESLSGLAKTMGYHVSAQYNSKIRGLKTIPKMEEEIYKERMLDRTARARKALAIKESEKNQLTLF